MEETFPCVTNFFVHTSPSSAQLPTSGTYINKFEKYQEIQTEWASPSAAFEINKEPFIVFGN